VSDAVLSEQPADGGIIAPIPHFLEPTLHDVFA
jgi:hypothetical protein